MINYSKEEQIYYTIKYYNECEEILNEKKKHYKQKTLKLLKKYKEINIITQM